ncbi:hypothetical protein DM860_014082 [Cuscuta australis]|uniref:Zinc finger GRF-type domain-containing protein n=1 Tax=Cuscuta australis TaxID=267555 RepID=A0A328DDU3_9ASTE|nr:hypothetical protein DM860_014082 [Cuscuta australis]
MTIGAMNSQSTMRQRSYGNHSSSSSSRRIEHFCDWLEVPTCKCGNEMRIMTAWTDSNPSRRFLNCAGNGWRRCKDWEWVDPPMCDRSMNIIPSLLKRINTLEGENEQLRVHLNPKEGIQMSHLLVVVVCLLVVVCVLCVGVCVYFGRR